MSLIVIVDDRTTNRTIYSRLALTIGENVKVRAFAEPAEALKWLERNRADLIVTDYDMPGMDGEEFISRFRGLAQSVGVPIMMITVNDQRKLRLRALESGATDFLNTPIDHSEFLMRARNLLKLSHDAESRAEEIKEDKARFAAPASDPQEKPPQVKPLEAPAPASGPARDFLSKCPAAGGYALHVLAFDPPFADMAAIETLLRGKMRDGDHFARIADRHFALLQRNVAGPQDARACARRLSEPPAALRAAVKVGTALPRPGLPPEQAATACLDAATALAQGGKTATGGEGVRFLPRIDLNSGALVGAQTLCRGAPVEAGDPASLRAALAAVASLKIPRRHRTRFSLRLSLGEGAGAIPGAFRLAPFLTEAQVGFERIDLQICAREAMVDPARAQSEARAARALGLALTLDFAALGPRELRDRDQWAALLAAFIDDWRPVMKFPGGDARACAVARLLRAVVARRAGCAPALLADGVPSPDRLARLRRAGVSLAQGPCFGGAFKPGDIRALLIAHARAQACAPSVAVPARRA